MVIKAAKYYIANKDVLKENSNSKYRNLSVEEKEAKKNMEKKRNKKKKEKTSKKNVNFMYSMKMSYYWFNSEKK